MKRKISKRFNPIAYELRTNSLFKPASLSPHAEDVLDWELHIGTPPGRPTRTIHAKLKFVGRSKPIPISDPLAAARAVS